jgi:hypothetical protein
LKFDHIGPGIPRDAEEPKTRIWLWLMNNCRVSIVVLENGSPDGSPKQERQIMFEVVPTAVPKIAFFSYGPTAQGSKPKLREPDEESSESFAKMPRGYSSEVGRRRASPRGKEYFLASL